MYLRKAKLLNILCLIFLIFLVVSKAFCQEPRINFTYIESRVKNINIPGGSRLTFWQTDDAALQEKEINASTLEIALITRAYLKHYKLFSSVDSLIKARAGLNFLYYMQHKNGCFYNYMKENGERTTGDDSATEPVMDETTAQAFLTIAEAANLLKTDAPNSDYNQAEVSFLSTFDSLKKSLNNSDKEVGKYISLQTLKIPAWLVSGRGDISGTCLLAMAYFSEKTSISEVDLLSQNLGRGILEFQNIKSPTFPPFAHLTFSDLPNIWKTANANQVAGLALGSKTFRRDEWLEEAKKETAGFLVHLPVSNGPIEGFYPHPNINLETPLSAYTLTYNFMTMANVTGDENYAKIAGICASWFYNNNSASHAIYSNDSGGCLKEISEGTVSNDKSLLGSACAILSIMEVYRTKGFPYLTCRPIFNHTYTIFESEEGKPVNEDFTVENWEYSHGGKGKVVVIKRRNTFWHKFKIDVEDDYFLLMSFQKQMYYSAAIAVNVRIDGGPILLVPLGGAESPYMTMEKITEPVRLSPGLHTFGVRYKGLLLTQPAIIDCVIMQPALERKIFVNEQGKKIMIVKNWLDKNGNLPIPSETEKGNYLAYTFKLGGISTEQQIIQKKGKSYLIIPPEGFGIIEW